MLIGADLFSDKIIPAESFFILIEPCSSMLIQSLQIAFFTKYPLPPPTSNKEASYFLIYFNTRLFLYFIAQGIINFPIKVSLPCSTILLSAIALNKCYVDI